VDERLDTYHWEPNGNYTFMLTRRKEFDVGNQESGNEEYKAMVWVVPEIVAGRAWSNTLSINLGEHGRRIHAGAPSSPSRKAGEDGMDASRRTP